MNRKPFAPSQGERFISQNIEIILNKIHLYESRYHRAANSIKLLAVTKNQSIENIQEAINAGQTAFGESYLQEALPKIQTLKNHALEWHFIGPIQSNKTRKIAENFHWVHSIENIKIAKRLSEQRPPSLPPLSICLQINVSEDPNKSGTSAENAFFLAKQVFLLPNLTLRGLMTIPKAKNNFIEQCQELQKLKQIFDFLIEKGLNLDTLSMGMSDDMEAAIAVGSTMVRIGTAIFHQNIP